MQVYITDAWSERDLRAVQYLEDEIFRREMRINLPEFRLPRGAAMLRLLARLKPDSDSVGTLTVVETTGDQDLHRSSGVTVQADARIARYTRLAVLPEHRGHGLSIRLMLEAHERFVSRNGIHQTWLLFDTRRAPTSLIASVLGFTCRATIIRSEYGPCRVLSRNEFSGAATEGTRRGWAFVSRYQELIGGGRQVVMSGD